MYHLIANRSGHIYTGDTEILCFPFDHVRWLDTGKSSYCEVVAFCGCRFDHGRSSRETRHLTNDELIRMLEMRWIGLWQDSYVHSTGCVWSNTKYFASNPQTSSDDLALAPEYHICKRLPNQQPFAQVGRKKSKKEYPRSKQPYQTFNDDSLQPARTTPFAIITFPPPSHPSPHPGHQHQMSATVRHRSLPEISSQSSHHPSQLASSTDAEPSP